MGDLTDIPTLPPKTDGKPRKSTKGQVSPKLYKTYNGKRLTPKQIKFVKFMAQGKPAYKAALAAYNTTSIDTANAIARENLQKPSIKQAVEIAMARHGITIDAAVAPIADGLKATKQVVVGDDSYETIDHGIRLKASGMALRLMGADQPNNNPDTPASVHFHKHLHSESGGYDE